MGCSVLFSDAPASLHLAGVLGEVWGCSPQWTPGTRLGFKVISYDENLWSQILRGFYFISVFPAVVTSGLQAVSVPGNKDQPLMGQQHVCLWPWSGCVALCWGHVRASPGVSTPEGAPWPWHLGPCTLGPAVSVAVTPRPQKTLGTGCGHCQVPVLLLVDPPPCSVCLPPSC